jgi:hypothetical protein
MKNSIKLFPLAMIVIMLLLAGCASTKKSKTSIPNYIGQWNVVISLPDGDEERYVKFVQEEDVVTGYVGGDQGEIQLEDLVIDEEKMSANFDVEGYHIDMTGNFEGDAIKGIMSAQGYEIPYEGTKQQ